jgi:hypothetical protein
LYAIVGLLEYAVIKPSEAIIQACNEHLTQIQSITKTCKDGANNSNTADLETVEGFMEQVAIRVLRISLYSHSFESAKPFLSILVSWIRLFSFELSTYPAADSVGLEIASLKGIYSAISIVDCNILEHHHSEFCKVAEIYLSPGFANNQGRGNYSYLSLLESFINSVRMLISDSGNRSSSDWKRVGFDELWQDLVLSEADLSNCDQHTIPFMKMIVEKTWNSDLRKVFVNLGNSVRVAEILVNLMVFSFNLREPVF